MAEQDVLDPAELASREQTDESLRVERERADAVVAEKRAAAEDEADQVVRTARDLADQVVQVARGEADLAHLPASESATVDRARAKADLLLEDRRSSEDAALLEQRAQRSRFLAEFLAVEREATDADLVRERDHADSLVSTRDEFLATVSHDMRNLLSGLTMNAASAVKHAPEGPEGDRTRRHATASQRIVGRLNRLVSDLLDVASIDAGKLSLLAERVEIGKIVHETLEAFEPIAHAKGVTLEGVEAPVPLDTRLDAGRVLQVLANLVSNAIKFTAAGGRVSISVRADSDQIQFAVSDTGIGIPEDGLTEVFQRYRQISRDRRGLGLGLYISKGIVEAHGGRMWAESKLGSGSVFHFALPVSAGPPAAKPAP